MKNQKPLIVIGIVLLVVAVGVGIFVMSSKKSVQKTEVSPNQEEAVATIAPSEIGLNLRTTSDNRKVILEVSKTEGISGFEYELSYTAKGDIPRGIIGHIDNKTSGQTISQEIVLGTCSDVCHYDEDVSNIKLVLKVLKTNGKTYQVEKSL